MELNYLRYFRTVVMRGNISAAARELYMTQPTLSKVISRMEAELNVQLFNRIGNKIELNTNGRRFYSFVEQTLDSYDACISDLRLHSASNILSLAYTMDVNIDMMIDACQSHFPGLTMKKQMGNSEEIRQLEEAHSIHAAFMTVPPGAPEKFTAIAPVQWYLLAHVDHPLVREHGDVRLKELNGHTAIVCGERDTFEMFQRMYTQYHMDRAHLVYEIASPDSILAVTRNQACAIVNGLTASHMIQARPGIRLAARFLNEPLIERHLSILKTEDFPAGEEYELALQCLCDMVRRESDQVHSFLQGIAR